MHCIFPIWTAAYKTLQEICNIKLCKRLIQCFLHQSLSTKEGPKSWRFAAWKSPCANVGPQSAHTQLSAGHFCPLKTASQFVWKASFSLQYSDYHAFQKNGLSLQFTGEIRSWHRPDGLLLTGSKTKSKQQKFWWPRVQGSHLTNTLSQKVKFFVIFSEV